MDKEKLELKKRIEQLEKTVEDLENRHDCSWVKSDSGMTIGGEDFVKYYCPGCGGTRTIYP